MKEDFLLIFLLILPVLIPLAYQGVCVLKERGGYKKDPKYKDHPEIKGVRKGDRMLYVNFTKPKG